MNDKNVITLDNTKLNALIDLVSYVKNNNKFYGNLYRNITVNEFEVHQLPLLKRMYLRNNVSEIISQGFCVDELIKESTYGTTEGISLNIYKSKKEHIDLGMSLWKYRRRLNSQACRRHAYYYYNTSEPNAIAQIDIRNENVNILFPAIKKSEKEYVDDLNTMIKYDVSWLICPPSIALTLSQIAIKYNVFPKLEMIEFLSEYIPLFYRNTIEKAFKCNTCVEYGCHEIWGMAFTSKQKRLSVMDNIILEKVPDDRFLNGYGQCVVTNLKLKALPFIRYELKDIINIKEDEVITYGFRASDNVQIGKNTIHCSFFSNIFECGSIDKILPLEDYQVVYNDKVICVCLHNSKDDSYCEEIREYLSKQLRETYKIDIDVKVKDVNKFYTDSFTGKLKGIIKYKHAHRL